MAINAGPPPQIVNGEITGRVLDATSAVVPGAAVSARHVATGLVRSSTTGSSGDYLLPQLSPGIWEVTIDAPGFSKVVRKGIEVNVGTRLTLNFELQPGPVSELVEVVAESTLLESTRSEISGVVTPHEVQNLPLLDRTFARLSVIMPEARPLGNFDPTKTRIGNFGMNGGDGRQLDVSVDGGDNKDNVVGSLLQNFAYEGIQEFQVQQHRWSAESGRSVGGVINVITRSGSNEYHGSLFTNLRDESWRRRDFFEKQRTEPKPDFSRQEFGGSFGGRIVRDRLFFFGTYEQFRERQTNIADPRILPQLQAIPGAQVVSEFPTPYDDRLITGKIDQRIGSSHSLFYRYSYQGNSSPNDQITVPAKTDLSGGNTNDNLAHSFVASDTWTLGATRLNQFSFHYQSFDNKILGPSAGPILSFPGGVMIGPNSSTPQATSEQKLQFRNDFSWIASRHALKAGVNYIDTRLDGFFYFGSRGYSISWFDDPLTIAANANGKYPQGFATPGAIQSISFADGKSGHGQRLHQVAAYVQDDYRVTTKLTLNLGLRWDVNIGNLPDQTENRTMRLLRQLDHPLARALAGSPEKLARHTPNWKEFQPRLGFAWDPNGAGRTVIRGGYGIFFDQLFQNLTLFSLSQSSPEIYQTAISLVNSAPGVGQLANFRYGIDPLPPPPAGFSFTDLAYGSVGRINDPDISEPYVQKVSIGMQHAFGTAWSLTSDYVHTLGLHEPRVMVVNPRIENICNPAFAGATPESPLCVRGVSSRLLDRAFVNAGLPPVSGRARIEAINMIGTTNRSLFDSWTTQLRYRAGETMFSLSYVLASSRAWGGQPVASYSGNNISTTPANQFKPEEFGPTRIDERHRLVGSGVFRLPAGIELAPIVQWASARPYSLNAGFDIDGDGLSTVDRICAGTDPLAVFEARGDSARVRAINPLGCTQARVNSQRSGFVPMKDGQMEKRSGAFFNADLRVGKSFRLSENVTLKGYADFFNLFDRENLSFASRVGLSHATSKAAFMQPVSLYGPGFGPPVGRPLTVQFGFRLDF